MTRLDNGVGVYTGFLPNSSGARDIPGELFNDSALHLLDDYLLHVGLRRCGIGYCFEAIVSWNRLY